MTREESQKEELKSKDDIIPDEGMDLTKSNQGRNAERGKDWGCELVRPRTNAP